MSFLLLPCKDGQLKESISICRHLHEGTSLVWVRIPCRAGTLPDYFCPDCREVDAERGPGGLGDASATGNVTATGNVIVMGDVIAICGHCADGLRREYGGKVYTFEEGDYVEAPDPIVRRPSMKPEFERMQEEIEESQFAKDRKFFDALGSELSEPCRQEGCTRGRVRNSVLCAVHHFENVCRRTCPF
jgi:hypothetical protein